jgi:anti-sigma B factor antagonist
MADFETSVRGDVTLLCVRGSLDAQSAGTLKPEVVVIGDSGTKKVVVDLSNLGLIDSSGVGVLISLFKRLRAIGGQVCFAGVHAQPREVFRLLRLDRSLDLVPTVDEALGRLANPNAG